MPKVYLPAAMVPEPALALYARSREPATSLIPSVREIVQQIDPRVPITEIGSLAAISDLWWGGPTTWLSRAAAFLGIVALLLAAAGCYAVVSYIVATRSREVAIRMALGALPRGILGMVLRDAMVMVIAGVILGGTAGYVISHVARSQAARLVAMDHVTFAASVAWLAAIMVTASLIPAWRAARIDPVRNLKEN